MLRRFPYMAVYLVAVDGVEMLAVVSVSRDPSWIEAAVSARWDG